ncbi:hypothetical protein [Aquipuribacter sp. SD81]|uniref:hypothetical protein n=1 Tax=Aquipuribacter sp. SD81 TaxID=3127703 RepID=UPI003016A6A0
MNPVRPLRRVVPLLLALAVVVVTLPASEPARASAGTTTGTTTRATPGTTSLTASSSSAGTTGTAPVVVTDVPVPPRAAAPRVAVVASSEAGLLVAEEPLGRPEPLVSDAVWLPVDGPPVRRTLYGTGPFALAGSVLVHQDPRYGFRAEQVATGSLLHLYGHPLSVGSDGVLTDEGSEAPADQRLTVHSHERGIVGVRGLVGDVDLRSVPPVHTDVAVVSTTDPATGARRAFAVHTPSATARRLDTDLDVVPGTAVQGGDVLAWWSRESAADGTSPRARVSRTTLVDGAPGPVVHSEPWPGDGSGELPAIVLTGGQVLLGGRPYTLPVRAEPEPPPTPVLRLADDGRLVPVGRASPLLSYPGGRVVRSDGEQVVVEPAPTDDRDPVTNLLWRPPAQRAPARGVALDGPRLLVAAADVRWFDPATLGAPVPSPSGVLADEASWGVVAHRGGALVELPWSKGLVTAAVPGARPPGGEAGRELPEADRVGQGVGSLSGDHHLTWPPGGSLRERLLVDLSDGSSTGLGEPVALHDSVLWRTAEHALLDERLRRRGAAPDLLVGRDLRTGGTRTVATAPGCDPGEAVEPGMQAAGRWLLVRCRSASWQLLDVLDERAPEQLGDLSHPRLGNGALLRTVRDDDGHVLQWRSLGVPGAGWEHLGPVVPDHRLSPSVVRSETVAVTTWGPTVSVAWVTPDGGVRHASLPGPVVEPSAPDGAASPPPPATDLAFSYPDDGDVTVSWQHPGGGQALGHLLVVRFAGDPWPQTVRLLDPGARSAALDLHPRRAYTVEVATVGPGGTAGAVAADVTSRLVRPAAPSGLTLDPSDDADRTTTLEWVQSVGRPAPTTFDVHVDGRLSSTHGYASTRVRGDLHRVVIPTPAAGSYRVRVVARLGEWAESSVEVSRYLPGPDLVAPRVVATSLPSTSATSSVRYTFTGSDDRVLPHFQVRARSAHVREPLGPWLVPTAWAEVHPALGAVTVALAEGETRCLQVRAGDRAGNWSAWSAERCVTRAVDDRHLVASGAHTRQASSAAMMRTATRLDRSGSHVRLTANRTDAVWLVATRCPTCGVVEVMNDGVVLARVDLRSTSTRAQQVVRVPLGRPQRTGTFAVRSASDRPAHVDGLVLRSY